VVDVQGPWVALRIGPDAKSLRWYNFQQVAGCMPREE
jgi:hypothetical protein